MAKDSQKVSVDLTQSLRAGLMRTTSRIRFQRLRDAWRENLGYAWRDNPWNFWLTRFLGRISLDVTAQLHDNTGLGSHWYVLMILWTVLLGPVTLVLDVLTFPVQYVWHRIRKRAAERALCAAKVKAALQASSGNSAADVEKAPDWLKFVAAALPAIQAGTAKYVKARKATRP